MKSKLLVLLFILLGGMSTAAWAQEEPETEDPVTPVLSKKEQKKMQKDAANQGTTVTTNTVATPAPATKTTVVAPKQTAPTQSVANPVTSITSSLNIGESKTNKSSNPRTQYSLDSNAQGNLNLYRPAFDTTWTTPSNREQARAYIYGLNPYPAKPRNMIEASIGVGVPYLSGDLSYQYYLLNQKGTTYGVNLGLRKSLGYIFSVKGSLTFGRLYGIGWKGYTAIINNPALSGFYDPNVSYFNQIHDRNPISLNYRMTYTEGSLNGIINLNNIRFHRERNIVSYYALLGVSGLYYNTRTNQLDENGQMYDYAPVYESSQNTSSQTILRKNKLNILESIWDNTYESQAEQDNVFRKNGIYRYRLDLGFNAGGGASLRINRRISVGIETRFTIVDDDLMDGHRWSEHPVNDPTFTPSRDLLNYTSVNLNYSIGKDASEPLWWLNPIDLPMVEMNETKNKLAKIPEFTDSDDDGIIDVLDREPNTPEGCPVDTHGVQIDSDKDGIPDCKDKEPFSIPGARVDADGVATNKTPELNQDSLVQLVKNIIASEGGGGSGTGGIGGGSFPGWYLPMIHFDLDKDFVKPDYYPDLYHIAQVMRIYPSMRIFIDGHTDIRNSNTYNEDLSRRRAINVRNFLIKNYGIDESRLLLRYMGESQNLVKDLPDRFDAHYEREQYMNRRVEFTIDLESLKD
jgi:OOP family OmpA-OmpF porin